MEAASTLLMERQGSWIMKAAMGPAFLSKELNMRSVSVKNMGVTAALLAADRFVDKPGRKMSEK
jgi:hypothetical protein